MPCLRSCSCWSQGQGQANPWSEEIYRFVHESIGKVIVRGTDGEEHSHLKRFVLPIAEPTDGPALNIASDTLGGVLPTQSDDDSA